MTTSNPLWFIVIAFFAVSSVISSEDDKRYDRREGGSLSDQREARGLEGSWYLNGQRDRRAEIVSSRRGLEATNERGETTRLEIDRNGDVRALDWEGGLRGNVRRDRIEWANGTTWTRAPSDRRR